MEVSTAKLLSTLASYFTIASCAFLKVPQIISVTERRSADGIVLNAMLMETASFTIMFLYNYTSNYSVETYLEYPIILAQVYVLFYYVLMYKRLLHLKLVKFIIVLYFALIIGFLTGYLHPILLSVFVPLCTPMSGAAKVSYLYGIIADNNADGVSITTWIISIFTNVSRIFTVYMDSGDVKLMFNFLVSTILSSSVLATAMYFKFFVPPPPPPGRPRRKPSYRRYSDTMHTD
ncbi:PQ-loop repeat-containing protein 3 [Ostrinia furnacalis]|uniref:PQ-loop repeat-containing protein 3 n=1 Tax=Ostrinia furnacalis TaxID=93504 RepID=UPI00103D2205|nr:PQ-loop repeat-containing protein 3 [Ostrinia furnacalis]XP_028156990.1 PQ-loop repeat-containing protein 3 [Ostrinia furnacalis]XP_028156991.1 PQ-loop repeat-containing protein 3 [Ostrinia furnacalis]